MVIPFPLCLASIMYTYTSRFRIPSILLIFGDIHYMERIRQERERGRRHTVLSSLWILTLSRRVSSRQHCTWEYVYNEQVHWENHSKNSRPPSPPKICLLPPFFLQGESTRFTCLKPSHWLNSTHIAYHHAISYNLLCYTKPTTYIKINLSIFFSCQKKNTWSSPGHTCVHV